MNKKIEWEFNMDDEFRPTKSEMIADFAAIERRVRV